VIGPGDLIVLNPEEAHAGGPPAEGSRTYRALYPRPDLMHEIMAEFSGGGPTMPEFGGDVVWDREVAARLRRFHRLSEQHGSSILEHCPGSWATLLIYQMTDCASSRSRVGCNGVALRW
jgi:AraC-like ligand binding domain